MKLSSRDLPSFIMTIGISGSGKSTWINSIDDKNTKIISPDKIRFDLTGDISDQSRNAEVFDLAKQTTIHFLNQGYNVILDATNVDAAKRKDFIKDLPPVQLKAKIFNVSPEEAIKRINNALQSGENRAKTPEDIVRNMHQKFTTESTPEKLKEEGFELI